MRTTRRQYLNNNALQSKYSFIVYAKDTFSDNNSNT